MLLLTLCKKTIKKEEKEKANEKQRKRTEEADEEYKRKEEAEKAEAEKAEEETIKAEEESGKAGTAGASGATTRSTEIGTELTDTNLILYRLDIIECRMHSGNFLASDLEPRILELEPYIEFYHLIKLD